MLNYVFGDADQGAATALTYGSLERNQSCDHMKDNAFAEVCATIEINRFRLSSEVSVL